MHNLKYSIHSVLSYRLILVGHPFKFNLHATDTLANQDFCKAALFDTNVNMNSDKLL